MIRLHLRSWQKLQRMPNIKSVPMGTLFYWENNGFIKNPVALQAGFWIDIKG